MKSMTSPSLHPNSTSAVSLRLRSAETPSVHWLEPLLIRCLRLPRRTGRKDSTCRDFSAGGLLITLVMLLLFLSLFALAIG